MKTLILTIALLALTALAGAQNTCVYPFSFTDKVGTYTGDTFSFCLSEWGTLTSLQEPIGVEHLDPANPVEGFTVGDWGIVPGINNPVIWELPSVWKYTPGQLPIELVWSYPINFYETVTADIPGKTVIITMTFPSSIIKSCRSCPDTQLVVSREAGLLVDGLDATVFASSGYGAFGYNPSGHGILLSGLVSDKDEYGQATGSVQGDIVSASGWLDEDTESIVVFRYKLF